MKSIIFTLILGSTTLYAQQDAFEQKLEKERSETFQGSETQEEKAYYEKVAPKNINRGGDYYMKSHPLQEAPLHTAPIEENPLQEAPLQEKPLQEEPIN